MEFRRGRGNGWFVLGVCSTYAVEDEGFLLEIACELIGGTPQKEGIQVMFREKRVNQLLTIESCLYPRSLAHIID